MRRLLRFAAVAVLLMLGVFNLGRASAGEITGTFQYPTAFEDGTPLALAQLERVRVEYGSCSGSAFGTKAGEVIVTPPATSFAIPSLAPGTYCARAFAKTLPAFGGQESAPSAVVSKTLPWPAPKPPTIVTVSTVVYELRSHPIDGQRLARVVGSVARGVACGPEPIVYARGADYHEVALDKVSLSTMPRSAIVVAQCKVT